jgi:hypothetical protein
MTALRSKKKEYRAKKKMRVQANKIYLADTPIFRPRSGKQTKNEKSNGKNEISFSFKYEISQNVLN